MRCAPGGALAYKNNIVVTPGATLSYQIGAGGIGDKGDGKPSWFISTTTVNAGGGKGGQGQAGGAGGTRVAGDGGSAGGRGSDQCYNTATQKDTGGAGGGAGGYNTGGLTVGIMLGLCASGQQQPCTEAGRQWVVTH
jgi:hypothetical protein